MAWTHALAGRYEFKLTIRKYGEKPYTQEDWEKVNSIQLQEKKPEVLLEENTIDYRSAKDVIKKLLDYIIG